MGALLFSDIRRGLLPHTKLPANDGKFVSFGAQLYERKASWESQMFAEGLRNFEGEIYSGMQALLHRAHHQK